MVRYSTQFAGFGALDEKKKKEHGKIDRIEQAHASLIILRRGRRVHCERERTLQDTVGIDTR